MAATLMRATITAGMYTSAIIFMLDFVPNQTHSEHGNRDVATASCQGGACGRVRNWSVEARRRSARQTARSIPVGQDFW